MKTLVTKLEKVNKENMTEGTTIIRRATEDDIDALVQISRISFPDQLIWCSKKQAEKTWRRFINSEFQEVWVYQFNKEVVAVIRFEKDSTQCDKEIKELRPGLFPVLCYLIVRPKLFLETVIGKIINKYSTNTYYNKEINEHAKKSIFCHTSAVLPKMRNQGIGSKMMSICEKRGMELGYDSIKFFIKANNKGSIRLHERMGFIRTAKIKDQYLYSKMFPEIEYEIKSHTLGM